MWFKGKRSRNKATVGEPAVGSLHILILTLMVITITITIPFLFLRDIYNIYIIFLLAQIRILITIRILFFFNLGPVKGFYFNYSTLITIIFISFSVNR